MTSQDPTTNVRTYEDYFLYFSLFFPPPSSYVTFTFYSKKNFNHLFTIFLSPFIHQLLKHTHIILNVLEATTFYSSHPSPGYSLLSSLPRSKWVVTRLTPTHTVMNKSHKTLDPKPMRQRREMVVVRTLSYKVVLRSANEIF